MIVLHDFWRSSAAWRVRIGLNLLGLDYRAVSVTLSKGEQFSPAHLAVNPQGLVPALEIDGLVLTQSLAILEYLDETRGPAFLPPDAAGRARVRALAHAVAMEIAPVANLRIRNRVAEITHGEVAAEDWTREVILRGFDALEVMLGRGAPPGPYAHGESPGLADICLVPQCYNARRVRLDLAAWPRIAAVEAALAEHPAIAAAHADKHRPQGA